MNNYKFSTTCQIPPSNLNEIYLKYFGYKTNGYFVEVGAFDGESYSNTSGLADIGWNGLYIEPVNSYYTACQNRHKKNSNIQVINRAISFEDNQILTINISGPLSTVSEKSLNNFKRMNWGSWGATQEIVGMTLNTTLEEYLIPINFDLLVIDVEGYEYQVLREWDINKWAPKMVIIELHDKNPNYVSLNEQGELNSIRNKFIDSGYTCVWENLSNSIFIKNA
jgi:FkbM family methyltransferase